MPTPDEKQPLVSVCMGVRYQREDLTLLERAVRSIQAQTYSNWEFLICERDSTPAAKDLLSALAREDSRIHILDGTGAAGLPGQLNCCLEAAKGNWIARMDDDDASRPDRIEKQLAFLQKNKTVAFVGCNVELYRNGSIVGKRELPRRPTVRDFYMTQPYIHPTLLFRREALEAVGKYSEDCHQILCEDYDLLLRLYSKGYRGANLEETLFDYTLPATAKGNRKMRHRWNEAVTRYQRFKELGCLPGALPWVIKPILVGLLPERLLGSIKRGFNTDVSKK